MRSREWAERQEEIEHQKQFDAECEEIQEQIRQENIEKQKNKKKQYRTNTKI
jgi:hypothetical protein